jgi:hypothetical protein
MIFIISYKENLKLKPLILNILINHFHNYQLFLYQKSDYNLNHILYYKIDLVSK